VKHKSDDEKMRFECFFRIGGRQNNKPRDVVSPPTVGGGTTSRGLTINLVMWFPHQLSVGKPHYIGLLDQDGG